MIIEKMRCIPCLTPALINASLVLRGENTLCLCHKHTHTNTHTHTHKHKHTHIHDPRNPHELFIFGEEGVKAGIHVEFFNQSEKSDAEFFI